MSTIAAVTGGDEAGSGDGGGALPDDPGCAYVVSPSRGHAIARPTLIMSSRAAALLLLYCCSGVTHRRFPGIRTATSDVESILRTRVLQGAGVGWAALREGVAKVVCEAAVAVYRADLSEATRTALLAEFDEVRVCVCEHVCEHVWLWLWPCRTAVDAAFRGPPG